MQLAISMFVQGVFMQLTALLFKARTYKYVTAYMVARDDIKKEFLRHKKGISSAAAGVCQQSAFKDG
jgi:hypothetical protein